MNLERYEILKRHIPEEAARVIAEAFPAVDQLVTKDYLDARLALMRADLLGEMHGMETSMHRWMLSLMATQWLGVAGIIVAIVLKG